MPAKFLLLQLDSVPHTHCSSDCREKSIWSLQLTQQAINGLCGKMRSNTLAGIAIQRLPVGGPVMGNEYSTVTQHFSLTSDN